MKKRRAFTLVEAAVSLALISIILLWSVNAYLNISKGSKSTEDISIASALATNVIEHLKTLDYSYLQLEIPDDDSPIIRFGSKPPFDQSPYTDLPYKEYGYKYANVSNIPEDNLSTNFYLTTLTIEIYRMNDTKKPLIQMDCNFLRNNSGKNAGL